MSLMDFSEYEATQHPTPYTLVLSYSNSVLYYFGERHSFDPKDPQRHDTKAFWNEYLKSSKGSRQIAFIEGGKRPHIPDEPTAILYHGGMGLVTHLANSAGIQTHSPEPDERLERQELEKRFSRDEIQYYYFARVVNQWTRKQPPRPDFATYITDYLESDKSCSDWNDYDFSLDAMKKVHQTVFQTAFAEDDKDFFYKITSPVTLHTRINEVSRASGEIRDTYIASEIQKYLENGYSIYAQFGATHVVMQEPLLRKLINHPRASPWGMASCMS